MEHILTPPEPPSYNPVLRIAAAAEYLGVCDKQVYAMFRDGRLTKTKLGSRTSGVRLAELNRWIESQQSVETSPHIEVARQAALAKKAEMRAKKKDAGG